MKREIKFKIFDTKYNEWIEDADGVWMITQNGRLYETRNDEYYVIGERFIVCQFTDIKGLYEFDEFIRLDTGDTFVVVYKKDGFVARRKYDSWLKKDVYKENKDASLMSSSLFNIEIIGNIHDK